MKCILTWYNLQLDCHEWIREWDSMSRYIDIEVSWDIKFPEFQTKEERNEYMVSLIWKTVEYDWESPFITIFHEVKIL